MKVLQINAIYEKLSTGKNTKDLHEYLLNEGIDSYVASPILSGLDTNSYRIGNALDWKLHALLSRVSGKQGYFSSVETYKLIQWIDKIAPDVVLLGNVHGNYLNLPMLLKYISKKDIATVVVLHDCWFFTGKCTHYDSINCDKWKTCCYECPKLKDDNPSWYFDRTREMFKEKERLFDSINRLAVVGVSRWITAQAMQAPILKNAKVFECIYNWIDLHKFNYQPSKFKEENDLVGKKVYLGVSAIWNEDKGLSVFLQLSKLLKEDEVIVLVGTMPNINLPSNVVNIPRTHDILELVAIYSESDIFLQLSCQETFGKVVAEALACNLPVITNRKTANPELVNNACGVVLNNITPEEVYSAIVKVNLKREEYSKNCSMFAKENFDDTVLLEKYKLLFSRILNHSGGE